jgi:hypothetical protein
LNLVIGWAILVVLAAIGALAYFGVLSPERFIPKPVSLDPHCWRGICGVNNWTHVENTETMVICVDNDGVNHTISIKEDLIGIEVDCGIYMLEDRDDCCQEKGMFAWNAVNGTCV